MRKNSLFNRKMKCFHCGGGMKSKKERKTVRYVCSNYDNYGNCQRIVISEAKLIKAINRRYKEDLSEEEIRVVVKEVIVKNDKLFDIILIEGKPISYHERGIIF